MSEVKVLFSEALTSAIDEHLALHPPERMQHVLGRMRPDDSIEATHWVFDQEAEASGSHVRASGGGQERIRQVEVQHGVRYLGVVHSHPPQVCEPSAQDLVAVSDLLRCNPHSEAMLVGVVVARGTDRRDQHVLRLPHGELAVHYGRRGQTPRRASLTTFRPERDFFHGVAQRLPAAAVDAVRGAHVVVVGCGSLGSAAAEAMTRAGVPRLTLIDPDVVEASNLSRSTYSIVQVGMPKVDALAHRLTEVNPQVQVRSLRLTVEPGTAARLAAEIREADLVLGLADDQRALSILDVLLHQQQVPGVFAGVYRAAAGGDVVSVVPGLTACYRCSVGPRVQASDLQPGTDYATGRLRGEVALGADVGLISALASRTSLALLGLVRGTDTWLEMPIQEGRTYTQFGVTPGFFEQSGLFDAVPGQHALQSIWVRPEGDPECEECGQTLATLRSADPAPLDGGRQRRRGSSRRVAVRRGARRPSQRSRSTRTRPRASRARPRRRSAPAPRY